MHLESCLFFQTGLPPLLSLSSVQLMRRNSLINEKSKTRKLKSMAGLSQWTAELRLKYRTDLKASSLKVSESDLKKCMVPNHQRPQRTKTLRVMRSRTR